MEPTRDPRPSNPAAAVPFFERKLDEMYQAVRGARYANALIDAKTSIQEGNYREALRLVRGANDLHARSPAKDWKKRAAQVFGAGDPNKEMQSRFSMVLKLLEKMSDAQQHEPKPSAAPRAGHPAPAAEQPAEESPPPTREIPAAPPTPVVATSLDAAAFTQLYTAAQQSGLVPNADAILSARDREFAHGHYQRALEMIEGLYSQMSAQATRRQQQLRQEETQFRAGTLKMSPKQWFIRQRQAREQTQRIDRARRYFSRVLDGLRVLRAANPEC